MAYTFPSLSANPNVSGWEEGVAFDPAIRTEAEGGYVISRARCTRIPDKWKISYRNAPAADKILLRAFEKTVQVGSAIFSWTNPDDGVTYQVRFKSPVQYSMGLRDTYWNMSLELEEA